MSLLNLLLITGVTLNFIGMTVSLVIGDLVGLIYTSVLFLGGVIVAMTQSGRSDEGGKT